MGSPCNNTALKAALKAALLVATRFWCSGAQALVQLELVWSLSEQSERGGGGKLYQDMRVYLQTQVFFFLVAYYYRRSMWVESIVNFLSSMGGGGGRRN